MGKNKSRSLSLLMFSRDFILEKNFLCLPSHNKITYLFVFCMKMKNLFRDTPSPTTTFKVATSPGTLEYNGRNYVDPPQLHIISYNEEQLLEQNPACDANIAHLDLPAKHVNWLDLEGLQKTEITENLGKRFHLHPLLLEDVLNVGHRPKLEEFEAAALIILKMLTYNKLNQNIEVEHISIIAVDEWNMITLQEVEGDVFTPVRERIRKFSGKIRRKNVNYLIYALIDAIVDNYFLIIEEIAGQLEELEIEILDKPSDKAIAHIHHFKRQMITLRKAVWPLREVVSGILRGEGEMIDDGNEVYMKDLYGNIIQVIESIELQRDTLNGLQDLCFSSISNKMNNSMKTLAVMSTIFMPLTLIAGIYGMNFDYMPELHTKYGYFMVLFSMLVIFVATRVYVRRITQ
jgi:magnesium transporter